MAVYMIIQTEEITDKKKYTEYASKARAIIEAHGGEYVLTSEKISPVSGDWEPLKMLVIKFPDMESYTKCFSSTEYLSIVNLRQESIKGKAVIAEY